jgi:hypothetical protein
MTRSFGCRRSVRSGFLDGSNMALGLAVNQDQDRGSGASLGFRVHDFIASAVMDMGLVQYNMVYTKRF